MSIEQAEQLKEEWTDKYVIVAKGVPELRRFAGLTGTVKSVNMNGKALVQFDGAVDISWYDIDPTYLQQIDAPLPKPEKTEKPAAAKKMKAAPAKSAPAEKPAGKGKSLLELARAQGAAGTGKPAGAKKPSPLEMARAQGAAKSDAPAAEVEEKKLSPLEQARRQGAGGKEKKPADEASQSTSESTETQSAEETAPEEKPPAKPPSTGGKKLSPLELARQQGAPKQ